MSIDGLGKKAASITAIIILLGLVTTGMTSYFAKAQDLNRLEKVVTISQIAEYNEQIDEVDDDIAVIELIDETDRTDAQKLILSRLESRKGRYLRNLEDLRAMQQ